MLVCWSILLKIDGDLYFLKDDRFSSGNANMAKIYERLLSTNILRGKRPYFWNILLKIGSKPYCTVLCTKTCLFRGDRHVLVVFHQMPYFLQHFAKNWVKTLLHGTLHKNLLISRRSTRFGGFSPNAILFATFC